MKLEDFFKNKEMFNNFNVEYKTVEQIDKEETNNIKINEEFFKYNLDADLMDKLINYIKYRILKEDYDNALNLLNKYEIIKTIYLLWAYEYELTSGGYEEFFYNRLFLKNEDKNKLYIEETKDSLYNINEEKLARSLNNAYLKYIEKEDLDKLDDEFYDSEVRFRDKLYNYIKKNKLNIIEEVRRNEC